MFKTTANWQIDDVCMDCQVEVCLKGLKKSSRRWLILVIYHNRALNGHSTNFVFACQHAKGEP